MTVSNKKDKFTEAYSNYFPLIFSTIYTKVGEFHEAEDICQEIFIRFYKKFDEISSYRKWLYGTMRYVLLEHYRKKSKSNNNEQLDTDDVSMTYINGFRDTRIIIEEAIDNLDQLEDKRSRTLFELIAINNFTYKEAGKQLGLSENQARYKYKTVTEILIRDLKKRGIKSLEELL